MVILTWNTTPKLHLENKDNKTSTDVFLRNHLRSAYFTNLQFGNKFSQVFRFANKRLNKKLTLKFIDYTHHIKYRGGGLFVISARLPSIQSAGSFYPLARTSPRTVNSQKAFRGNCFRK